MDQDSWAELARLAREAKAELETTQPGAVRDISACEDVVALAEGGAAGRARFVDTDRLADWHTGAVADGMVVSVASTADPDVLADELKRAMTVAVAVHNTSKPNKPTYLMLGGGDDTHTLFRSWLAGAAEGGQREGTRTMKTRKPALTTLLTMMLTGACAAAEPTDAETRAAFEGAWRGTTKSGMRMEWMVTKVNAEGTMCFVFGNKGLRGYSLSDALFEHGDRITLVGRNRKYRYEFLVTDGGKAKVVQSKVEPSKWKRTTKLRASDKTRCLDRFVYGEGVSPEIPGAGARCQRLRASLASLRRQRARTSHAGRDARCAQRPARCPGGDGPRNRHRGPRPVAA